MSLNAYLRLKHAANCDCSVCWSRRDWSAPTSGVIFRSTQCDQCRPASPPRLVNGRWTATPFLPCAKHTPPRRPPKYWNVTYDSGNPTPFVPIREPFELEG